MSQMIDDAVQALNARVGGSFDGSAKFVIEDEGSILLDSAGARAGDEAAEVTMTADEATFREIIDGTLDPTTAFMTGRLTVDGDMGQAMALASALG
jgi:putative sterol carrier protein